MSHRDWILAGLVIVAGVGLATAVTPASKRPTVRKGERVLVMGDSLGVGLATPLKALVLDEKALDASFGAIACGGTACFQYTNPRYAGGCGSCFPTSNCSTTLRKTLDEYKPSLVLVSFGTNEAFGTVDAATIVQSVKDLVAALRAAGASVIWIGPPKLPARYVNSTLRPEIIKAMRETVAGLDVPYFDSSLLDIPQFDGIHATPKGYAGWAGAVWQWLRGGAA